MRYSVTNKDTETIVAGEDAGPIRVMGETEFFDMLTYEHPGSANLRTVIYL
jgi:hypothetical protein